MISPENTGIPTCLIVLKLQATQFVHTLADVRRLKNSIANAIVSNVTVGLSKTAEQFRTLCTQSHCRLLHLWRGHGPDLWGSAFQMASTTGNLHQFQDQLHCVSMKDYEYTPITVMGAVAEAIATKYRRVGSTGDLLAKASHQKTETSRPPTHMARKLSSRQSDAPKPCDITESPSPYILSRKLPSTQNALHVQISPVNCYLAKPSHCNTASRPPPTHDSRKLPSRQSEPPKPCDITESTSP